MSDDDNVIPVDFAAAKPTSTTLRIHRKPRTGFGRATMGGRVIACGRPRRRAA